MTKVIKDVKKQADSAGQKILGAALAELEKLSKNCLLYTSPSPRDA